MQASSNAQRVKSSIIRDLLQYAQNPEFISLAGGIPGDDLLDVENLRQATVQAMAGQGVFQYSVSAGLASLRTQIAAIMHTRTLPCVADEIVITTGSQQALDLCAKAFLNAGDGVLVCAPTYLAALQSFKINGLDCIDFPCDQYGAWDFDAAEELLAAHHIKAVYLIPNFANPSSVIMDEATRIQISTFCLRHQLTVIEDDPYGELWFEENPYHIRTVCAMMRDAGSDDYVYMSSFSKIVSPGLRVGWLHSPHRNIALFVKIKQSLDLHTAVLSQAVVAHYLAAHPLPTFLPKLRAAYAQRMHYLFEAIEQSELKSIFADSLKPAAGGLFLWLFAPQVDFDQCLSNAITQKIIYVPGSTFFVDEAAINRHYVRLSFSSLDRDSADKAVQRLSAAIFQ